MADLLSLVSTGCHPAAHLAAILLEHWKKLAELSCKHRYKSSNSFIYFVKKAFTRKLNGAFVLSKVQKDFRLLITGMRVALDAHVGNLVEAKHIIDLFLKRVLQMYDRFHREWK